jgi:hypothetical protein
MVEEGALLASKPSRVKTRTRMVMWTGMRRTTRKTRRTMMGMMRTWARGAIQRTARIAIGTVVLSVLLRAHLAIPCFLPDQPTATYCA